MNWHVEKKDCKKDLITTLGTVSFMKTLYVSKEKKVEYLYIDADEDHYALQFQEKKGDLKIQKHMPFTLVSNELFCDGLYLALALREFKKIMKNPKLLKTPLEKKVEDTK